LNDSLFDSQEENVQFGPDRLLHTRGERESGRRERGRARDGAGGGGETTQLIAVVKVIESHVYHLG
jgi:hypothetical protein